MKARAPGRVGRYACPPRRGRPIKSSRGAPHERPSVRPRAARRPLVPGLSRTGRSVLVRREVGERRLGRKLERPVLSGLGQTFGRGLAARYRRLSMRSRECSRAGKLESLAVAVPAASLRMGRIASELGGDCKGARRHQDCESCRGRFA
jgi:hypothetical protein